MCAAMGSALHTPPLGPEVRESRRSRAMISYEYLYVAETVGRTRTYLTRVHHVDYRFITRYRLKNWI